MQDQIVVPVWESSIDAASDQYIRPKSVQSIACAASGNIDRLRDGVVQCVQLAFVTREDVASAMIDHAIQLSAQADDAVERYGYAVSIWGELVTKGIVEGGRHIRPRLPQMILQRAQQNKQLRSLCAHSDDLFLNARKALTIALKIHPVPSAIAIKVL